MAARPGRERRARAHDGRDAIEEARTERRPDVHGAGPERDAARPNVDPPHDAGHLSVRLHPGPCQDAPKVAPELARAPADEKERLFITARPGDSLERFEAQVERLVGFAHRGRHVAVEEHPPRLGGPGRRVEEQAREERAGPFPRALERQSHGAALEGFEGVGRPEGALGVPHERFDARAGDPHAEEVGRDVLDLMRFVEDDGVVRRQDAGVRSAAAGAKREVGEQQVVVDDDDLRLLRLSPHPRHEARLEVRAAGADARLARRGDVAPDLRVLGQIRQLGPVPGLRGPGPVRDAQQRRAAGALPRRPRLAEASQADVVGEALHERGAQRDAVRGERLGDDGQVLDEDLLLERARRRRDDHLSPAEHGRHEIRQGLAGSGPGLDEEVAAPPRGPARRPRPSRAGPRGAPSRGAPARAATRARGRRERESPRGPWHGVVAMATRSTTRAWPPACVAH